MPCYGLLVSFQQNKKYHSQSPMGYLSFLKSFFYPTSIIFNTFGSEYIFSHVFSLFAMQKGNLKSNFYINLFLKKCNSIILIFFTF